MNKLVQNKQSRLRKTKGLEVQGVDTVAPKDFTSRRQAESYLKRMGGFLSRKADFTVTNSQGAALPYREIQEAEQLVRRVNQQKKRQWDKVKDLDYKHRGIPTGLTVSEQANPKIGMGDPKFSDLKEVTFNPSRFRSAKELKDYLGDKRQLYTKDFLQRQNELYRDNYLKAMYNSLGDLSKDLQEFIKNMPLDEFIEQYYTENNAHINFVYDRLAVMTRIGELERVWGV